MNELFSQFRDYLIGLRSLSPSTADNYIIKLGLLERATGTRIHDITEDELQKYFLEIRPLKRLNTIRLEQSAVRAFYKWYEQKTGKPDPTRNLKIGHEEYTSPDLFTPEEFQKMMFACGDCNWVAMRNRAMLALLADTGIRLGELVQLKVGNIHLDEVAKGNKRFIINIVGSTKSYRQRSFPFCEIIERGIIAENWCMYWGAITDVKNWHTESPLFQHHKYWEAGDGPPLSRASVQSTIKRIAKRAGIEKNIHVHTFRHVYATYCKANELDDRIIQYRLGHATPTSTFKYIHLADKVRSDSLSKNPYQHTRTSLSGFAKAMKNIK